MIEAQNTIEDQNTRLKLNEAEHGKDTAQALREIRRTNGDLHHTRRVLTVIRGLGGADRG